MNFLRGLTKSRTVDSKEETKTLESPARTDRAIDLESKCKDGIQFHVTLGEEDALLNSTWDDSSKICGDSLSDTAILESPLDDSDQKLNEMLCKSITEDIVPETDEECMIDSRESSQEFIMITSDVVVGEETAIVSKDSYTKVSYVCVG